MLLTEYETTVVVRPDIGGDAIEATLDRIRDAVSGRGGKMLHIDHWGKKKLAYPIKKHSRGIYVHTQYLGGNDVVAEVERNLRISDTVLRFLTVQLEIGVDPVSREEKEYVVPTYEIEEPTPVEEAGGGEEGEATLESAAVAPESAEVAPESAAAAPESAAAAPKSAEAAPKSAAAAPKSGETAPKSAEAAPKSAETASAESTRGNGAEAAADEGDAEKVEE
ncbi:MAG: 30S ribosomal protein S6 [Myxococcota bacterium]